MRENLSLDIIFMGKIVRMMIVMGKCLFAGTNVDIYQVHITQFQFKLINGYL